MLNLEIQTPASAIYSGEVSGVNIPGTNGKFEILNNHAPLISTIAPGTIRIATAEGEIAYETTQGVVEVLKNKVIILVEKAEKIGN